MASTRIVASLFLARLVTAQNITFPTPTGDYSTKAFDYALASTYLPNNDFSNEQLAFLWDQVGIITTGAITTTVSPTPEPTAFPRPGYLHPMVQSYMSNISQAQLQADFKWGVSGAAFQIEGAAKDEGKGPTNWEFITHRQPGTTADNTTGDSISWARIFPFGKGPVNEQGVKHYDDVIAEHVRLGIEPVITLFHWDTPLALMNEYGSWSSPQIVDDYFNFAKFIIERYDEYVSTWYAFNEPQYCQFQYASYPNGILYPGYHNISRGLPAQYTCGLHTLLASAKIMKWYKEEFKGRGRISMKMSIANYVNNSTSAEDLAAQQQVYDFNLGWFSGSWTEDGDYPSAMRETLGDLLPTLSEENKPLIKDSQDFFAIDPYQTYYVASPPGGIASCANNSSHPACPACVVTSAIDPTGFPSGPASDTHASSWLWSNSTGIRQLLSTITKNLYPSIPDIVISEFGSVEPGEGERTNLNEILWDLRRADYFQGNLENILAARVIDGVNVTGAFAWAIYDNIEWFSRQVTRFGLQHVNYSDPLLTRTPKASIFQFTDWFKQHMPS